MATFLTNPNQAEETMKSYLQMIKTLQEMKGKTMK
jgi:hypothetical protein